MCGLGARCVDGAQDIIHTPCTQGGESTISRPLTLAHAQASLAWWAVVSPFAPYGPTLSLLFVLAVAAIKAIVEDRKRHQEDSRTNSSTAHVLHADGARLLIRCCQSA